MKNFKISLIVVISALSIPFMSSCAEEEVSIMDHKLQTDGDGSAGPMKALTKD